MPVVYVRVVRMAVQYLSMTMPVAVRHSSGHRLSMIVLVMLVVNVSMFMLKCDVMVLVTVALAQM